MIRLEVVRRWTAALALLSAAVIPMALVTTGAGAQAAEPPASIRYAPGTPGMLAAQDIARRQWGVDPCNGQVAISWGTDEPTINARSYWANPRSAYDAPQLNVQCRIVLNTQLGFDWAKFCTVVVHEYGHLAGHPHVADGPDVMSPLYRAPLPACVATPESTEAPVAIVPAAAAAPVAPRSSGDGAPRGSRRVRAARVRKANARAAVAAPTLVRYSSAHD